MEKKSLSKLWKLNHSSLQVPHVCNIFYLQEKSHSNFIISFTFRKGVKLAFRALPGPSKTEKNAAQRFWTRSNAANIYWGCTYYIWYSSRNFLVLHSLICTPHSDTCRGKGAGFQSHLSWEIFTLNYTKSYHCSGHQFGVSGESDTDFIWLSHQNLFSKSVPDLIDWNKMINKVVIVKRMGNKAGLLTLKLGS